MKTINIRISEELKVKLDIYCAKNQVNITKLLIDHIEELVEGEDEEMKKYRVETVEYEKDLQTLKNSWTELETDDKEEALEYFEKLKNQIRKGGVIINEWEDASQDYVWMDEYNLEKSLIMKTWEEENYTVVEQEHDYDLHKFEVYQDDELIGTIYPDNLDDQEQIKKHLDNHVNVNGWETNDGEGGEITLK